VPRLKSLTDPDELLEAREDAVVVLEDGHSELLIRAGSIWRRSNPITSKWPEYFTAIGTATELPRNIDPTTT
jgi:hypothetical protein